MQTGSHPWSRRGLRVDTRGHCYRQPAGLTHSVDVWQPENVNGVSFLEDVSLSRDFCVYMRARVCVCLCVCVSLCVCVCVCVIKLCRLH